MSDQAQDGLILLSEHFTNSTAFQELFRDGMDLVEETAAYLDGDGRVEAKALARAVGLTYATESMRLTTRLMQLASWLLLHRAVREGEMTLHQANREKTKVKLTAAEPGATAPVEKLLGAAGPCRVRLGIDVEVQRVAFLAVGRAREVLGSIGHNDLNRMIIRMNFGFHGKSFGGSRLADR